MTIREEVPLGDFPFIVAELNTGHRGSIEAAKDLVLEAKRLGASAVKLQSWAPESLFTEAYLKKNDLERRLFEKFSLSEEELGELISFAHQAKIQASSTAYSEREVEFLARTEEVSFIKIASMDLTNIDLVRAAVSTGKIVILSTGMSEQSEVERTISAIDDLDTSRLVLLHCTSIYPTPLEHSALGNIEWLNRKFPGVEVGFSDHTIGAQAALVAVGMGVRVFEKHFSLDNSKPGFDNHMAAGETEFGEYIHLIKAATKSYSEKSRRISAAEQVQALSMRRSAHLLSGLNRGEVLHGDNLVFRRPGTGLGHFEIQAILGKRASRKIEAGEILSSEMFN